MSCQPMCHPCHSLVAAPRERQTQGRKRWAKPSTRPAKGVVLSPASASAPAFQKTSKDEVGEGQRAQAGREGERGAPEENVSARTGVVDGGSAPRDTCCRGRAVSSPHDRATVKAVGKAIPREARVPGRCDGSIAPPFFLPFYDELLFNRAPTVSSRARHGHESSGTGRCFRCRKRPTSERPSQPRYAGQFVGGGCMAGACARPCRRVKA